MIRTKNKTKNKKQKTKTKQKQKKKQNKNNKKKKKTPLNSYRRVSSKVWIQDIFSSIETKNFLQHIYTMLVLKIWYESPLSIDNKVLSNDTNKIQEAIQLTS